MVSKGSPFDAERAVVALTRLESSVVGLYLPDPARGERERAKKPIVYTPNDRAQVYRDPDGNLVRGRVVWTSQALQTSGYTLHECFAQIQVIEDTVPAGLGMRDLLTIVLEGSCGSPWVELDTATIQSDGRTGVYMLPLLSRTSLALATRLVVYMADNADYEDPPPAVPRQIRWSLDGFLVSGPTF